MIILIDNYDSFVYNLYQYLTEFGYEVKVFRNDEITIDNIISQNPSHIVISPGPGRPENAGIICELIKKCYKTIPILGVCLGHQAIGYAFGASIIQSQQIMHGKVSKIYHNKSALFVNIDNPFNAVRYHSLVIDRKTLPAELEITAHTDDGEIMGVQHKEYKSLQGIQFHPESILTEAGKKILLNFLNTFENTNLRKNLDLKQYILKVVENISLTRDEAINAMNIIMTGNATASQIAAFMTALRLKTETIEEITGFAEVMRAKATKIKTMSRNLVDTCGTGGDMSNTFNISTCAAIIAAAAGVKIAKHGNRSVSSSCGSADILTALGVKLDISPENVGKSIDEVGIGFLFAPLLHTAMKYAMTPRREMGIRTVFNILGPLSNPANAEKQLLGVYDGALTEKLANVLKNLGIKQAYIVHGADGIDEITLTATTRISELDGNNIKTFDFNPLDLGLNFCALEDIKGGSIERNVEIFRSVLAGTKSAYRDIAVLNAAFAIKLGISEIKDLSSALKLANAVIDDKKAKKKLNDLIEFTNNCK